MLGLKLPTDPRWASIAGKNIEEILVDHAWCEQKAASNGISLIVNYNDFPRIVQVMTELVEEEWNHFTRVLNELKARGYTLGPARKDEYAVALFKHERKGGSRESQLVEKLLISALIEARSCERFKMLSEEVDDKELSAFYHELMASEAGHYRVFLDLAKEVAPAERVKVRWNELLDAEADIINNLQVRNDRMH